MDPIVARSLFVFVLGIVLILLSIALTPTTQPSKESQS